MNSNRSPFFNGRNGSDQLSVFLVAIALLIAILNPVFTNRSVMLVFNAIALALAGIALFRMLSTNVGKRRNENEAFLSFFSFLKADPEKARRKEERRKAAERRREEEKTHCFFRCPKCHRECRVPRGRGKIRITCPSCGEKFIKRT